MKEIIDKIGDKFSLNDLVSAKLQPSDSQLLLSEMYRHQVERISPPELLKKYQDNKFIISASIPQSEAIKLDEKCFSCLPSEFESVEFSPVAPLGLNSVLSNLSQNIIMSCVRNVEVMADPTTAMALECSSRRRQDSTKQYNLATTMRCLRLQPFEKETGFTSHFRVFALGSSDRYSKDISSTLLLKQLNSTLKIIDEMSCFTESPVQKSVYISNISLTEQIISKLSADRASIGKHTQDKNFDLFKYLSIDNPSQVNSINQSENSYLLNNFPQEMEKLRNFESNFLPSLKAKYPEINFIFDLSRIAGIGYYNGVCYKVLCTNQDNLTVPIADGGSSDWVSRLLSDNKECYFSTGIGTELFYKCFNNRQH
ncbi:MAG: hypothetical protein US68_C0007G0033 [Candidatus Shapirobacteria bacterium GW2011_GWE1_38_10]|uniref:Uncharacterized protein n=1 Tax=Candidatus Shapirobacteria bacterium GW2011_GWE1_38_10 TaxID=1618488 RepID=A0A0G0IGZ4_9BACT|nr:MAG: hypothetical protein US46_C0007G0025 [Candidatus Shapirobacteria bacterium GW2011_GWF2_37_20]KKQ50270.1 MAG: hypothetical protein US68_C0007G0033 [Candidatus Shapirobacteria bacterium GW2011_GWE1_38_10]KKQ64804.1 MAG: hypothetical protein US85_C0003G0026 [Candidatus Shapirobacteria bacterium GW2011_GWF1_38_23]